jgi:uncharacterized protein
MRATTSGTTHVTKAPGSPPGRPVDGEHVQIPQYSRRKILAVWAAAALPMGVLAWLVVPAVAGGDAPAGDFAVTLLTALTFGLVWQSVLVLVLVLQERRRDPSWTSLRDRLWLRSPSTETRRGGRLWWWVGAYALGLAALDMIPFGFAPENRDMGSFLESAAGQATFHHAWGLYALVFVQLVFNTVIGEELLFRGLLLPRMRGAFGRADWVANGVLTGLYHLHQPWSIPSATLSGMLFAYPTRRFRSAWMGIAIHSAQSVFFAVLVFAVVVR